MRIISWNVNGLRSNIVDFTTSKNKNKRNIKISKLLKERNIITDILINGFNFDL